MYKNILMCIEYDGTRYSGWQRQGNTDNTIEKKITDCLKIMCVCRQDIELHGSGRTDMGVHAKGQMANTKLDTKMCPDDIMEYLNKFLPEDIRIKSVEEVDERFHARLNARAKTYCYMIDNCDKANVFYRKYSWHVEEKLDLEKMREGARILEGKKDFRSLSDMKTNKSSVRTINSISIAEESGIITIKYTGDGFLYHMVRKITALLVEIGTGRVSAECIQNILDKKDRQCFRQIAPAKGLCLEEVFY